MPVAVESKDAYLVAKLMEGKQKALSALNGQMLQESDEWQQLFRNLDNLTVQQLEKLSNTIKEKAKGLKLNPIDAQAVTNSLKEVDEKIRTMNPFGLLSKHLKEYKKAEDDVTKKNALKECSGILRHLLIWLRVDLMQSLVGLMRWAWLATRPPTAT